MKEKDYVFEIRKAHDDPRIIIEGAEVRTDDAGALMHLSEYARIAQALANILKCDMHLGMFPDGGGNGLEVALRFYPEKEEE